MTGGEVSDFWGFDALVDDDLPTARVFLADRGYDSDHIRKTINERGGTPVIPAKANRKKVIPHDTVTYALRNRIERCFAKLKCSRRKLFLGQRRPPVPLRSTYGQHWPRR